MPDWSNESMSTTPLLSIGLFLYNGDRFLEAAIESILNQTFRDFELIISDNCSTDRSEEICRRFAAQDSRIRYYRAEHNMGAGWNLRNVYFKATGKYFKWAAHDDMIQPDFLRLCIDALEADDSLVVAHTLTRCIDERGQFVESNDERLRTSSLDPVVRARDLLLKEPWRLSYLRSDPSRCAAQASASGQLCTQRSCASVAAGTAGTLLRSAGAFVYLYQAHGTRPSRRQGERGRSARVSGMERGEGIRSFRSAGLR